MWTLKDKFEVCWQSFLIAVSDHLDTVAANKPFVLETGIIGSTDGYGKPDLDKIHFLFPQTSFTADQINSIKRNTVNFLFGNLARATSELFRSHLKDNGYPEKPSDQLDSLTGNLKSLAVIVACLGNAYAHNPCEGVWNITANRYKQIWKFKHIILPGTTKPINVDLTLDLTNANGNVIDFDKYFGGFGNVCYLLLTCKRLFWNEINILDI